MLYASPGAGVPGVREVTSPCSLGAHPGDKGTNYTDNVKALWEQRERLLNLPGGQGDFMKKMQFFLSFEFRNL